MLYCNQIGECQAPPPYQFPNVEINSFRLSANLNSLANLCDQILNVGDIEDRGFEFRPIFPFVDLEVLHYPRMQLPLWPLGFVVQNECYVRLFVMKYVKFGNTFIPDGEVAIFCPILVVDNSWSAFAGRDVLGFPKLLGIFDPPPPLPTTNPFTTVSTQVLTSLTTQTQAGPQPVIQIQSGGPGAPAIGLPTLGWPWGHIEQDLRGSLVFPALTFECVQMKQFRDPTLPFDACYQAILQSATFIEAAGGLAPLPPARVTITDYPTFQLAANLGIPSGQPQTPISQYHLQCSFGFGDTITLFADDRPWWWWW